MNDLRLTRLQEAEEVLGDVRDEIQERGAILQEEFDERSESWQESESGEEAQAAYENLEEVASELDNAISALQLAQEFLENLD